MAIAAPRQSVGPTTQLSLEYQSVGNHFWKAKNQLKKQTPTFRTLLAVPLAKNNPAHIEYSRVIISADAFLKIADENNIQTWMIDPVLYFGGLAHFTLGNYSQAAEMFARLSSDYKRNVYINDRDPVNPEFSVPTHPGISKLLFYCRLQTLPDKPADAFSVLQQITTEALKTLTAQQEYAFALANKRSIHDRRDFVEGESPIRFVPVLCRAPRP